ncbi:MAG: CPBP family intramembrane metalloprotease [Candidatus Brocadia sp.]|uniref:CAAX prenyl protease 2/Lysostaphin resistance protein A-like domain-containing protein n=1 Tax=Candidatus Brocadia fulgida TaxID=380242 RepID=A0A0M2UR32_9BACT|nr:MAG: hypothetical protein BROFUL_02755 [Candidatus Brocadia fulgida]MCC6325314.1 CPBP family intramembrane metalloprotease [Candidatus Brocadia sp.]UJS21138.1 MAG: CPBP family intramembrane metalloprotease [Candidatus Brocadia sp.]
MNSWSGLKQYNKIFLLFFLVLVLSSLLAPLIKAILDTLLTSSPFIKSLLNFKQESYDFGRVMRRIMMAVAILLIFFLRKPLKIGSLIMSGIKPIRGWRKQLQTGFLLGTGMFVIYVAILWLSGIQTFRPDTRSFADIVVRLLTLILIAGLVGGIEELLFRGFIFQSMLVDMRAVSAIAISSLFFSSLHFFKVKYLVSSGIQPFIGFIIIYQSFKYIVIDFVAIWPALIGLFLVGAVLSYSCLRTKSLYLAIGLHAGWVFLMKTNKLLFDHHAGKHFEWLFGDHYIVTGVLGWIFLLFTFILIRFITKATYHGKDPARAF